MRFFKYAVSGLLVLFLIFFISSNADIVSLKSAHASISKSHLQTKQSPKAEKKTDPAKKATKKATTKKAAKKTKAVKKVAKKKATPNAAKKTVKKKTAPKQSAAKKTAKRINKKTVDQPKKTNAKQAHHAVHQQSKPTPVASQAAAAAKPVAAQPHPQPQAQPASAQDNPSVEQQIVGLVNQVRTQNGLGSLQVKAELTNAARQWSSGQFANGAMSHGMMNFSRTTVAGQNVAYAKGDLATFGWDQIWSAQATMDGWMNSPEHRANILKPDYKYIGVGVIYGQKNGSSDGWAFFTQDFSD
ncbi:CAP domain-containing protein [Sporolactobacillus terrae]|uniref:CAP domain-containing protein n=1 Tax=Sporolactobacillus terrae TaxID=269673 RepID=UPI00111B21F1|nr:CAP domain-containing protein [Sporolactobacillus terrae]